MIDCEWWVLVEPKTNRWRQVSEDEARFYPVVQCRLKYALTHQMLDALLDDNEESA
jgi:hypothetical protein